MSTNPPGYQTWYRSLIEKRAVLVDRETLGRLLVESNSNADVRMILQDSVGRIKCEAIEWVFRGGVVDHRGSGRPSVPTVETVLAENTSARGASVDKPSRKRRAAAESTGNRRAGSGNKARERLTEQLGEPTAEQRWLAMRRAVGCGVRVELSEAQRIEAEYVRWRSINGLGLLGTPEPTAIS